MILWRLGACWSASLLFTACWSGDEHFEEVCEPTDERSTEEWLDCEFHDVPLRQILPEFEREIYLYLKGAPGGSCFSPIVLDLRGVVLVPDGACRFPQDYQYTLEATCAVGSVDLQLGPRCSVTVAPERRRSEISLLIWSKDDTPLGLTWSPDNSVSVSWVGDGVDVIGSAYLEEQDDCGLRAEGCCLLPPVPDPGA